MSFHRVEGHEHAVGDFLIRESCGHSLEHLVFAFADAEFLQPRGIEGEGLERNGLVDNDGFFLGELESGPSAHGGKDDGEGAHIKLDRQVAHEVFVLKQFEHEHECRQG